MGKQIIKQPDGLYAIYSSIVDAFTWLDCTEEDVVQIFVDEATERARIDVRKKLDQVREGGPRAAYAQFGLTWEQASRKDEATQRRSQAYLAEQEQRT